MHIVIIEDEALMAEDLKETILLVDNELIIAATLKSVVEGIDYFQRSPLPDLIFSDIQLGDGLSFDIFFRTKITVPVIFCTAYDEYALNAFKANGIDYILKPFSIESIAQAIGKFKNLKNTPSIKSNPDYEALIQRLTSPKEQLPSAIIVHRKDKVIPIKIDNIALFYTKNEMMHLHTFEGKTYYPNKSLDEMKKITGERFFRVNRQFLINKKAIIDASSYLSRKMTIHLSIPFSEPILMSKEKTSKFMIWLTE